MQKIKALHLLNTQQNLPLLLNTLQPLQQTQHHKLPKLPKTEQEADGTQDKTPQNAEKTPDTSQSSNSTSSTSDNDESKKKYSTLGISVADPASKQAYPGEQFTVNYFGLEKDKSINIILLAMMMLN